MNRFIAVCAITLASGLAIAHGAPSRPLDSKEMDSVRGGCWVLTSLPCTGTTQRCNEGGCFTNTTGSFCTYQGLAAYTASGSYSWFTTGLGLQNTMDGGNIQCGTYIVCQTDCIVVNGRLVCRTGAPTPYYQSQVVPAAPACTGS